MSSPDGFEELFADGLSPDRWSLYEFQWGPEGSNNGCVPEYVELARDTCILFDGTHLGEKNVVELWGHGEQTSSSPVHAVLPGVRRVLGGPVLRDAGSGRVGCCLATRDEYASCEVEADVRFWSPWSGQTQLPGAPAGAVFAMWTFHYEEHYSSSSGGSPAEGLLDLQFQQACAQGSESTGLYSTVNSEIDCPEIGKNGDYSSALFNSYVTETKSDLASISLADVNLLDGAYHRFGFRWETQCVPLRGVSDADVECFNGHHRLRLVPRDPCLAPFYGLALRRGEQGGWFACCGRRVQFSVDGRLVRESRSCSAVAARLILGIWFPQWAGPCAFEFCKVSVARVCIRPLMCDGDVFGQRETYLPPLVPVAPLAALWDTALRLTREQYHGFVELFSGGISRRRWLAACDCWALAGLKGCGALIPDFLDVSQERVVMWDGADLGPQSVLQLWASGDRQVPGAARSLAPSVTMTKGGYRRTAPAGRLGSALVSQEEFASGVFEVDFRFGDVIVAGVERARAPPIGAIFSIFLDHREMHYGDSPNPESMKRPAAVGNPCDPQFDPKLSKTNGGGRPVSSVVSRIDFPVVGLGGRFDLLTVGSFVSEGCGQLRHLPCGQSLADGKFHRMRMEWRNALVAAPSVADSMVCWCNGYHRLKPEFASSHIYGLPLSRSRDRQWFVHTGQVIRFSLDGNSLGEHNVVSPVCGRLHVAFWLPDASAAAPWMSASVAVSRVAVAPLRDSGDVWFQKPSSPLLGAAPVPDPISFPQRFDAQHAEFGPDQAAGFVDSFQDGLSPSRWAVVEGLYGLGNNGCVPEYVSAEVDPSVVLFDGTQLGACRVAVLRGHGEVTTNCSQWPCVPGVRLSASHGVSAVRRDAGVARVGSSLVTREKFGSGTWEFDVKFGRPLRGGRELPGPPSGCIFKIHSFAYEKHHCSDADPDGSRINADDLQYCPARRQGVSGNYYSTVNSEIDCCIVGHSGSFDKVFLASWTSEERFHPAVVPIGNLFDGVYHRFSFSWETKLHPLPGLLSADVGWANGYARLCSADVFPAFQSAALVRRHGMWYACIGAQVVFRIDGKVMESWTQDVPCVASRIFLGIEFPATAGSADWEWAAMYVARAAFTPSRSAGDVLFQDDSTPVFHLVPPVNSLLGRGIAPPAAANLGSFPAATLVEASAVLERNMAAALFHKGIQSSTAFADSQMRHLSPLGSIFFSPGLPLAESPSSLPVPPK